MNFAMLHSLPGLEVLKVSRGDSGVDTGFIHSSVAVLLEVAKECPGLPYGSDIAITAQLTRSSLQLKVLHVAELVV